MASDVWVNCGGSWLGGAEEWERMNREGLRWVVDLAAESWRGKAGGDGYTRVRHRLILNSRDVGGRWGGWLGKAGPPWRNAALRPCSGSNNTAETRVAAHRGLDSRTLSQPSRNPAAETRECSGQMEIRGRTSRKGLFANGGRTNTFRCIRSRLRDRRFVDKENTAPR